MDIYYVPDITLPQLYLRCEWKDNDLDFHRLYSGLIYSNLDEAVEESKRILDFRLK